MMQNNEGWKIKKKMGVMKIKNNNAGYIWNKRGGAWNVIKFV
jgi:hypothetical protein